MEICCRCTKCEFECKCHPTKTNGAWLTLQGVLTTAFSIDLTVLVCVYTYTCLHICVRLCGAFIIYTPNVIMIKSAGLFDKSAGLLSGLRNATRCLMVSVGNVGSSWKEVNIILFHSLSLTHTHKHTQAHSYKHSNTLSLAYLSQHVPFEESPKQIHRTPCRRLQGLSPVFTLPVPVAP